MAWRRLDNCIDCLHKGGFFVKCGEYLLVCLEIDCIHDNKMFSVVFCSHLVCSLAGQRCSGA